MASRRSTPAAPPAADLLRAGIGRGHRAANASTLFGPFARVGVVGLGTGSLACYRRQGQNWTFFEIDPVVLNYSRNGSFTYMSDCAPQARSDRRRAARAGQAAEGSLDVLAIDAFSSDAIPLIC